MVNSSTLYSTKLKLSRKGAGINFYNVSNSYVLKDEYYHCLTSDATMIASHKCPIIGKQAAFIRLPEVTEPP